MRTRDKVEGWEGKGLGNGYKLYYMGTDNKRNGVGIVLSPELKQGVWQVSRVSDRAGGIQGLYNSLEEKEEQQKAIRLAKQKNKESQDV